MRLRSNRKRNGDPIQGEGGGPLECRDESLPDRCSFLFADSPERSFIIDAHM